LIELDGSLGEGGGQILRSSLSLSLLTGKAFRLRNIRARRKNPGLARQHLMAVQAAALISSAKVTGDKLGSTELVFQPGKVQPGTYQLDIGTAGSTTLVLQTLLLPLLIADRPSQITITGGTHNMMAPPANFLAEVFLPLLSRQGAQVTMHLKRYGFYPAGGGCVQMTIEPGALGKLWLVERGSIKRRRICAVVSRLPLSIAQREADTARRHLGWSAAETEVLEVDSPGPGNAVWIQIECEHVTELFTAFGQRGVPAEKVALQVVKETRQYLRSGVPVGRHLADQLLLPMVLGGGGRFRTLPPSSHTSTNIEVLRRFVDVDVQVAQLADQVFEVAIDAQGVVL